MSPRSTLVWVKHTYGGEKAEYRGGVIFRRRSAYHVLCKKMTSLYKDARNLEDAKQIIDRYIEEEPARRRKKMEVETSARASFIKNPPLAWMYTPDRKALFAEYRGGFVKEQNGKYTYSIGDQPFRPAESADTTKRKIDNYLRKHKK